MLHCAGGTGPQKSTLLLPLIRSCCPRSRHDVRRLRYTFRVGHSQPCHPEDTAVGRGTTRRTRSLSSLPARNGPRSPSVVRCGRYGRIPHVLRGPLKITGAIMCQRHRRGRPQQWLGRRRRRRAWRGATCRWRSLFRRGFLGARLRPGSSRRTASPSPRARCEVTGASR
jgi:hypothetical protein